MALTEACSQRCVMVRITFPPAVSVVGTVVLSGSCEAIGHQSNITFIDGGACDLS